MITVQVKKNQIVANKAKLEPMTSGSQNVYPVQFLFSSEWAYLEKIAVFATELGKDGPGSSVYNVLLDDNDRCFIPWEVNLSHSNHVYVGVYGSMNGNVVLPTIWCDLGNVVLGVTTGLDSEPPTPDIHDQILAKLSEIKADVTKYKTEMNTSFNATAEKIKNDALGKIAEIRNLVADFTNSGLQIINGATITNKDGFPDKKIPVDSTGDGGTDSFLTVAKFPRAYILTNTTIASNAGETSSSWSFLNEPVYVREDTYVDENQNETPAVYVTDMLGKTYAFLTDNTGNFNDMIEVPPPSIKYESIEGAPDLSDVTRTKAIAITLKADQWVQTTADDAEESDTNASSIATMQTVRMFGISAVQRNQLIFPVPREDCEKAYFESNIMIVGQAENELQFRAVDSIPEEDIIVYVYVINSTAYQWVKPPEPTPSEGGSCSCPVYDFSEGLMEEEIEPGKISVKVDAVDNFDGDPSLPMSMGGVKNIVGNIHDRLAEL